MSEIERRASPELHTFGNMLDGYAAVFDVRSADLGGFYETVRPGAFRRCLLDKPDVLALWNHNVEGVLGRTKSGTLRLREDRRGLNFQLDVAKTAIGRDVLEMVGRGDVSGASFAFRVREERWSKVDGENLRELIDLDLHDIAITPQPAYVDATVARRHLEGHRAGRFALELAFLDTLRA
jgi:HK97 family phage prohead protease